MSSTLHTAVRCSRVERRLYGCTQGVYMGVYTGVYTGVMRVYGAVKGKETGKAVKAVKAVKDVKAVETVWKRCNIYFISWVPGNTGDVKLIAIKAE